MKRLHPAGREVERFALPEVDPLVRRPPLARGDLELRVAVAVDPLRPLDHGRVAPLADVTQHPADGLGRGQPFAEDALDAVEQGGGKFLVLPRLAPEDAPAGRVRCRKFE